MQAQMIRRQKLMFIVSKAETPKQCQVQIKHVTEHSSPRNPEAGPNESKIDQCVAQVHHEAEKECHLVAKVSTHGQDTLQLISRKKTTARKDCVMHIFKFFRIRTRVVP